MLTGVYDGFDSEDVTQESASVEQLAEIITEALRCGVYISLSLAAFTIYRTNDLPRVRTPSEPSPSSQASLGSYHLSVLDDSGGNIGSGVWCARLACCRPMYVQPDGNERGGRRGKYLAD